MRSVRFIGLAAVLSVIAVASAPPAAAAPAPAAAAEVRVNYDVVEGVAQLLTTNFDTDMATLTTAKGVTALAAIAAVHKRVPIATAIADDSAAPALSVLALRSRTNAKSQGSRDSQVETIVEFFIRGSNADTVRRQAELALEAVMMTVDRIYSGSSGLFAAGEEPFSVECELDGNADAKGGQEQYEEVGRVRFVTWDRETGL